MKQKRAKREREKREREKRGAFSIVDSIGDPDGTAQTSLLHRYLPVAVILCVFFSEELIVTVSMNTFRFCDFFLKDSSAQIKYSPGALNIWLPNFDGIE
jgi:hypothetical protein